MIPLLEGGTVMLLRLNPNGAVEYRSSLNPGNLQKDKPYIKDGLCYLGMYRFKKQHLDELIKEKT